MPQEFQKPSLEIKKPIGFEEKEKPLYKYVDRTVDHRLEQRMNEVEGGLEDM